jgi:hypothetical protein
VSDGPTNAWRELEAKERKARSECRKLKRQLAEAKKELEATECSCKNASWESYLDASALAILSESVLGLTPKGEIPDKYKDMRNAVQWALQRVSYRHAWCVCGPQTDAMNQLLKMADDPIWVKKLREAPQNETAR